MPDGSAAYVFASEALANVAKHAQRARRHRLDPRTDGRLVAQVHDGGRGGAEERSGSGLRGLADRVGALNGTLAITSPPGAGTPIQAEIPCAS